MFFAEPGGVDIANPNQAHSGGIVGQSNLRDRSSFDKMRHNEQPIIALKGEGIFTQEQMRALAPLSAIKESISKSPNRVGPSVSVTPVVNVQTSPTKVEVINNSGATAEVETVPQSDGTELTRIIIGSVINDISSDGDISRLLKGKFGLRHRTGLR